MHNREITLLVRNSFLFVHMYHMCTNAEEGAEVKHCVTRRGAALTWIKLGICTGNEKPVKELYKIFSFEWCRDGCPKKCRNKEAMQQGREWQATKITCITTLPTPLLLLLPHLP